LVEGVRVGKGLLNGLIAWAVGFALWMIPAFAIAFGLTYELGSQGRDASSISAQIGRTIPGLYAGSRWLTVALIVATALCVFWRARALARGTKSAAVVNGLIVGAVAATLTVLLLLGFGSLGWPSGLAILAYAAAGAGGGLLPEGVDFESRS
jgi:hypothetical protein